MDFNDYHSTAGNWREELRHNERKTLFVIGIFLAVYMAVGLLADILVFIYLHPHVSIVQVFFALLSLKIVPYATIIMIIIAGISLLVAYGLYDKIMLLGTD